MADPFLLPPGECLACDVLADRIPAPGGVIYQNEDWVLDHSTSPVLLPGFLIIKPKRHVEHLAELSDYELQSFAHILGVATRALTEVLRPEKVYACSFGESVRHIHFYVIPRMANMPANGFEVLNRMFEAGLWSASDDEAAALVERLRIAIEEWV